MALLLVLAGPAALVIGAIGVLVLGTWWAMVVALAAHALGTLVVMSYALSRANQGGRPDPMAETRIEETQRELKERRRKAAKRTSGEQ
jgi:membrane protein implicated in regulation of membrane protease activity